MQSQLNSAFMYEVCGTIILFVAVVCVIFLVRSYRAGKAIGMDPKVLKRTITSSATFSLLPSVGILLGVIALSGSLGTPWPWLRLSVIGALHYETQVAEAAAEQTGIGRLSMENMTPRAFATIALLMSICIMWGMVLSIIFNKSYIRKLNGGSKKKADVKESSKGVKADKADKADETDETDKADEADKADKADRKGNTGFGDSAMAAMFIGLVSAYIGSYIGGFVSGNGKFTFSGDITPIVVAFVSAAVMAVFTYLSEKKHIVWLESFSIAASMLAGMIAAVFM